MGRRVQEAEAMLVRFKEFHRLMVMKRMSHRSEQDNKKAHSQIERAYYNGCNETMTTVITLLERVIGGAE